MSAKIKQHIEYAIVIKNKTRLESLVERFNTKDQAKFYIERSGGDFNDYEQEHDVFQQALSKLQTQLSRVIKYKVVERKYLPNYIFTDTNLIVVIGQDGLVANTAKYANGRPIIAVNPDRRRYDGVLLPFNVYNFLDGVAGVIDQQFRSRTMRFAEARLNDGQRLLAFNELFVGVSSHISARYKITYNQVMEEQSSSGLIISTQAGSTGWLSSMFNMAYGVTNLLERDLVLQRPKMQADELIFVVREPFESIRTHIDLTVGVLKNEDQLMIESLMPANGVIFSDGIETDFIRFNSGSIATIGLAKETAELVLLPR